MRNGTPALMPIVDRLLDRVLWLRHALKAPVDDGHAAELRAAVGEIRRNADRLELVLDRAPDQATRVAERLGHVRRAADECEAVLEAEAGRDRSADASA